MSERAGVSRSIVLSLAAAGFLLLGIGIGVFWGGGPQEEAASTDAHAEPHEEQDTHATNDPGMDGMAMSEEGTVQIARPLALGIVSIQAEAGTLRRTIRSTGHVTYDETRLSRVSPRFGGWVERIHVDFTGRFVEAGEPLLEIYSPELVSAQDELLAARRLDESLEASVAPGVGERGGSLLEAARQRLLLWDISPEQIRRIEESGEVRRTLTLHAPTGGFVVEKHVELGGNVRAGADLYRIADLSRVWLEIEVHEGDLRFVRLGDAVEVRVDAYPGEHRAGRIAYVYPDMDRATRTARVRVELANTDPDRRLMPGMFATAHLDALVTAEAILVPRDAVLHFGDRDVVFVEAAPGSYEVREVGVGATAGERTQILEGLEAGERVVARANFILDAESRLMETMMGQPGMEMDDMEPDDMDMDDPSDMGDMDMPAVD